MSSKLRAALVMHGGVILFIGLLSGFLAVADSVGAPRRGWESVHQTLLVFGVWMVATGGAAALLRLPEREARGLFWSLVANGLVSLGSILAALLTIDGARRAAREG